MLATAGAGKLVNPVDLATALSRTPLLGEMAGFRALVLLAEGFGGLEVAVALLLVHRALLRESCCIMFALGCLFLLVSIYDLAFGLSSDCGCFGGAADVPPFTRIIISAFMVVNEVPFLRRNQRLKK